MKSIEAIVLASLGRNHGRFAIIEVTGGYDFHDILMLFQPSEVIILPQLMGRFDALDQRARRRFQRKITQVRKRIIGFIVMTIRASIEQESKFSVEIKNRLLQL